MASSSDIYFNTGSVGIGSSLPAQKLDVSGNVNVSGFVSSTGYAYATNTSWVSATTRNAWFAGPLSVVVPFSGTYLITYMARVIGQQSNDVWYKVGVRNVRTNAYVFIGWGGDFVTQAGLAVNSLEDKGVSGSVMVSGLLAHDTLFLDYYLTGSGTGSFSIAGDSNGYTSLSIYRVGN